MEELQAALEEAEATLEMEENKVLRAQLELAQVKQEIDRRVAEKEDEFNNTRKNHARAMDSIGASIETEQRAKGEALRVKKQLEGEINELEIGLDHANKANSEGLKSIKRYQGQLRETIQLFEDEARAKAQITEQVGISERKAASLSGEVEESKALLDGADRAQRQLQGDIADARAAVNNMQTINGRDMTAKRQLESSIHTLQAEVDGMLVAAKNAEEKSKKAMVDAARLADELRAEQDHATSMGTAKNSLGNQLGELEGRLADAENAAMKGGKAAMAKMERGLHGGGEGDRAGVPGGEEGDHDEPAVARAQAAPGGAEAEGFGAAADGPAGARHALPLGPGGHLRHPGRVRVREDGDLAGPLEVLQLRRDHLRRLRGARERDGRGPWTPPSSR